MKTVFFETGAWERQTYERLREGHEVIFVEEPLGVENVSRYEDADVISMFTYSDMSAKTLSRFRDLKLVATRTTGYDHIDVEYCRQNGIGVCNVPAYGDVTVAEHVFALLLALSHRILESVDRTRKGDFSNEGLTGFDLAGKTMGVIGTGNIGRNVIRIAKGFDMDVLAYDIKPDEEFARQAGFRYAELDSVLSGSDVITIHVPATPQNRHMISDEQFRKMRDCTVFINTARGSVVDVRALLRAIAGGKVAAAGLDVLEEEPAIREEAELLSAVFKKKYDLETLLADHILLRMRNVVITPHNAFNTREAIQRIQETTLQNILAFTRGEPRNLVAGTAPAKHAEAVWHKKKGP